MGPVLRQPRSSEAPDTGVGSCRRTGHVGETGVPKSLVHMAVASFD